MLEIFEKSRKIYQNVITVWDLFTSRGGTRNFRLGQNVKITPYNRPIIKYTS
jgi:hypothetical protein